MIEVTYQKANGEIFKRIRNTFTSYRVGETTSIGWIVVDIKYNYKGKYYSKFDYDRMVERNYKRQKNLFKAKMKIWEIYRSTLYCILLLFLLKGYEITTEYFI